MAGQRTIRSFRIVAYWTQTRNMGKETVMGTHHREGSRIPTATLVCVGASQYVVVYVALLLIDLMFSASGIQWISNLGMAAASVVATVLVIVPFVLYCRGRYR